MHLQYTHLNWISLSTKCLYTLLYTSVVIFLFHIDGAAERGAQSCSYTLSLLPFTDRSNVLALKRCVTVASATKTMRYCKCLHSAVLSQTPQELWRYSRADTLTSLVDDRANQVVCLLSLSLSPGRQLGGTLLAMICQFPSWSWVFRSNSKVGCMLCSAHTLLVWSLYHSWKCLLFLTEGLQFVAGWFWLHVPQVSICRSLPSRLHYSGMCSVWLQYNLWGRYTSGVSSLGKNR